MAVLLALTLIVHITQAIHHKKFYCFVIIMSAVMQTLSYIFRIISINDPASQGFYALWFVLMLV
jgi:hypothetical protein